jgi:hypothetical protein
MVLLRAYVALMKLRVVELLLISTIPAMILAAKGVPSLGLITVTLVGGTLAAGSANAFNMVLESDLDKLMERTSARPLVTGAISKRHATVFATVIAALSLKIGSSISYTATVKDQFGRVLPNASVAMSGGTRNAVTIQPTAITDATGKATFTVTDAPAAGVTSLTDTFSFTASYIGVASGTTAAGAITWSATTVPPSPTTNSTNTPADGDGTSNTTLSVSISIKISS